MSMAIKAAKFQGDPGIFGTLGRQAKGAVSTAVSTFVPGPVRSIGGAALSALRGRFQPGGPTPGTFTLPSGRGSVIGARLAAVQTPFRPAQPGIGSPVTRVPGIRGSLQRLLPGGATGFEVGAGGGFGGIPPKGFHLNKTGYFLQTGEFIAPMTRFVRNRRRNPGNMRAADRALSRIESAKRMAKRLGRVTIRARKC